MNIPAFTAEATLYNTRGHYRSARPAINLVTQTGDTIRLALGISDEGIEVHSCRPGFIQIGEGATMVCVDPTDPFGTRGHDGGGLPGNGGGVPTDSGGRPPRRPPQTHGCTSEQLQTEEAGRCIEKMQEDVKKGEKFTHYVRCSKDRQGNPIMGCCQDYLDGRIKRRRCAPIK